MLHGRALSCWATALHADGAACPESTLAHARNTSSVVHGRAGRTHTICQIRASHFALILLQLLLSCCRLELQSSVAFCGLQEVIYKLLGQRRTALVQRISVVQRLQLALQLRVCVCIHGLVLEFCPGQHGLLSGERPC